MGRLSGRAQDGRAPRGTGHAVATERGRRQRRPPIRMRIRHGRSYRLPGHWKTFEMRCQLPKGRNAPVRQLETPNEIRDFWDWLTKSARDLPPRGDTARRLLEDGTEINLRQNSESGGPTIEVVTPGSGKNPKVHLPLPFVDDPPELPPVLNHSPATAPALPAPGIRFHSSLPTSLSQAHAEPPREASHAVRRRETGCTRGGPPRRNEKAPGEPGAFSC